MSQQVLSDYERKKPSFEWHKALLVEELKIHGFKYRKIEGYNDSELLRIFAKRYTEEWEKEHGAGSKPHRIPTIDNRLRDLAREDRIVRIQGLDKLKHNFHPDVFLSFSAEALAEFFGEYDINEWVERVKQE